MTQNAKYTTQSMWAALLLTPVPSPGNILNPSWPLTHHIRSFHKFLLSTYLMWGTACRYKDTGELTFYHAEADDKDKQSTVCLMVATDEECGILVGGRCCWKRLVSEGLFFGHTSWHVELPAPRWNTRPEQCRVFTTGRWGKSLEGLSDKAIVKQIPGGSRQASSMVSWERFQVRGNRQ